MSWWGWIIAGAILLGAELAYVNAQFYLVFIGSAAIVVGLVTAVTPGLQPGRNGQYLRSWRSSRWSPFAAAFMAGYTVTGRPFPPGPPESC